MKTTNKTILASVLLLAIGYTNAADNSKIQIKQVIVGPQAGDKPSNFSINISLNNNYKNLNNWQFGFYMPRNFRQTSTSNRNLSMKICDNTNQCTRLAYQKAKFTDPDLSTVFTTIVKPVTSYPLQKNKKYTISLQHNSSRAPQNYSSLPQNFFITNNDDVINLATTPGSYVLTKATAKADRAATIKRISSNWQNSSTLETPVDVIPSPAHVTAIDNTKFFSLTDNTSIHNLAELDKSQINLWQKALQNDQDISASVDTKETDNGIILNKVGNSKMENPEGYNIDITASTITVTASHDAGFFYALQTLRQLWFKQKKLTAMTILDTPKFRYRGVLLDAARHYFTVKQLKNFIDVMAAAKLNTLHLHLSDDEAFRLELDDYPQLAKIGATRGYGKQIGPMAFPQKNLGKTAANETVAQADTAYGDSYSKSDMEELIKYANLRQITIIPEIDIPGHSRAMMKAMPEAFYEAADHTEYAGYGDDSLPVCAYGSNSQFGKKFTSTLNGILADAAGIFANQTTLYAVNNEISIGGDEVFNGTWEDSPECQQSPWKNMSELEKEHYFLDNLNDDARIGKLKLSGWHEFVLYKNGELNSKHGIAPNQVGHVWVWDSSSKSIARAVTLANASYPVVLEYSDYLYMDMTYTPELKEPGLYWATKFADTYALLSSTAPIAKTIARTRKPEQILGVEAAVWADVIPSYSQLQYMTLPKLAGLAEASWSHSSYSSNQPNWRSLANRMGCGNNGFLAYLHQTYNVTYRGYPNGISLEAPQACNN